MAIEGIDLLNLASAAVLAALAVFLLVRKGRNATTHALAVFAIGLALLYGGGFLPPGVLNDVLLAASYVVIAAGMVGLAWLVPSRLDAARARRAIVAAAVLGFSYTLGSVLTFDWGAFPSEGWARILRALAVWVYGVAAFASVLFAYRGTRPDAEPGSIRSLAILGLGLALFGGGLARSWTADAAANPASAAVDLLMVIITGLAWFRFGASPSRRSVRRTSLAVLGVWTAATFAAFVAPESTYPLGRILGTFLLVYAVLRGQIAGIDAKVRFGISKGTVAGIVVAIVFVVSEGAQSLFGEDRQWLGLLVGGSVVFAIAPLQRAADRLAEKAVPVAGTQGSSAPKGLFLFEQLATRLAADGTLSPADQGTLAHVAQEMGLGAGDVHDVLERIGTKR